MATADLTVPGTLPTATRVRGARHNNLRDVDVDAPLWRTVAGVAVSGSGKTSLAIGTLYAEGMQRYLAGPSTYSQRRLTQAQRPDVDRIDYLPPALALRQRPPAPGPRLSMYAAGEVGVRLDVPYESLTRREREIVLHRPPMRQQVTLHSGRDERTVRLTVNYDNAVAAAERSLRSDNERTRRSAQRFVITRTCSVCYGTRLRPEALASRLGERNIAEIGALSLAELREVTDGLAAQLPDEFGRVTTGLLAELSGTLTPLLDVGLSYLTLDRSGASLSTGERQRIELTSTLRATGSWLAEHLKLGTRRAI